MVGKDWERLERKKVYEARDGNTVYMELYQDRVRAPSGKELTYTFYHATDVAIVVPFIDKKRLVMIRQYRYPLEKVMLEFPAGHVEEGESPLVTARRELKEETGYAAKKIEHVYSYHPSVSKSRQVVHVFRATGLEDGDTRHDATEEIKVETVSVAALRRMIGEGKVENAGTLIGYLLCCAGGGGGGGKIKIRSGKSRSKIKKKEGKRSSR
ncbi:NUDIX hydrolase [Nitrososphaera sp.]|uniref:NUDIX hydrolase n=1 Tax=Nitrososphaera sp. TaxID=1971748 RepID=UPI00307EB5C9